MAVDLLSQDEDLCTQPLSWYDSDGLELSTPPIFICIDYGHAELLANLMLLHNTDILDTLKGGDGNYSALQWASWTVCFMLVRKLSISSNHLNSRHRFSSSTKGNLEIVKILVEEGRANVDDEALSLAREYHHNEVAEYLLEHIDLYSGLEGDSDAIMEKACREGDLNRVQKLLDVENYNIDKWKDVDGKCLALSPLHLAVKNCHVNLIQLFAERGVQVE
jgi:ankyrin repeat protein